MPATRAATALSPFWDCPCDILVPAALEGQITPERARRITARLVLDADALNAVASSAALQTALAKRAALRQGTILTPHPLEAARLLGCSAQAVQADRLAAAQSLVQRFGCVCVLKGSGSVVAGPGRVPAINPTGNARLATAGTGDVLAGMLGAHWATGKESFAAACSAVYQHGRLADRWPADQALVASALSKASNFD